jgi:hypothetical protein
MLPRRNLASQLEVHRFQCNKSMLASATKIRLSAEEPRPVWRQSNNGAAGVPARPPRPSATNGPDAYRPPWGLCVRQNCPMLETVADPDGGCAPRIDVGDSSRGSFPLLLSTMQRLTARFLLLVLFAGTLAPLAAATSVPSQHEHCMRTPLDVRTQSTPSCHHHVAAEAHEPSPSGPISKNNLHSNPCCTGHECCRPLARALWAQVSLQSPSQQTGRTSDRVLAFQPHVRALEFATYHSVRAPPAL